MIALKIAAEALLGDQERAEVSLNAIGDAVLSTDIEGKITYLNTVAERMTGWRREEAFGRLLDEVFQVVNKGTREPARNPLEFAVQQDQTVSLTTNCVLVRRDGFESAIEDSAAPIRDREGRVVGAVIVFRDVGEAQALARKMSHLAQHDFLTELPNRMLLNDRLSQAIAMVERHRKKLAVLFVIWTSSNRSTIRWGTQLETQYSNQSRSDCAKLYAIRTPSAAKEEMNL